MATLKEIADDLGISHTLVSCVASGRMGTTRVSEATRQAILTRIREVGFQPNRLARALKGGRKGYAGVFLHKHGTYGSELNENFINAISDSLAERGLGLWLRFFTCEQEFIDACSQRLLKEVDGLIVAGIAHPELYDSLRTLQQQGLPIVGALVNEQIDVDIPNVSVNVQSQGWLAARHLIDLGCKRIARLHCYDLRQTGFLKGLHSAHIDPVPALMIPSTGFSYEDGLESAVTLIRTGKPFDGLFADSDALAAAAVNYMLRTGWTRESLPKIVGTDDSPIARHCAIPLTSVTSEIHERARTVVKILFDRIDGKDAASVSISPRLIVRESTDAALSASCFADN